MAQNKIILFFLISSLWVFIKPAKDLNIISVPSIKKEVISCAVDNPAAIKSSLFTNIETAQSGNWSNPSTWVGGIRPMNLTSVKINANHIVTLDTSVTVNGILIYGTLRYKVDQTLTLQSKRNIIGYGNGLLQMRPISNSVKHTLRCIEVNESLFTGGGDDPLEFDVGLWMMENSYLDLQGTYKKSWTNVAGSISAGATTISVSDATGWLIGDTIRVFPTRSPHPGFGPGEDQAITRDFESRAITAIAGNVITLSSPLAYPHPSVTIAPETTMYAEVINSTRNVIIEGTTVGRSHLFIRSNHYSTLKYVQFNLMGVRKDISFPRDGPTEPVGGRYVLHFHRSFDGSRGSIVDGCAANHSGNRVYVPHLSYGIDMVNNVSYYTFETAFWWDPQEAGRDILWQNNVAGLNTFYQGAGRGQNSDIFDDGAPARSGNGFFLGSGFNIRAIGNIVVGTTGDNQGQGGFTWAFDDLGTAWEFKNNLAHNNSGGIVVWQNTQTIHTIVDYSSYHNVVGIFHGAYANIYRYSGGIHYASPIQFHASSMNTGRLRLDNAYIDAAGQIPYGFYTDVSGLGGAAPILLYNVTIKNSTIYDVYDDNGDLSDPTNIRLKNLDIVDCQIDPTKIRLANNAFAAEQIRVQPPSGQSFKLYHTGVGQPQLVQNISSFAPLFFGNGQGDPGLEGLKATYYNSPNWVDSVYTRTDPMVAFFEWNDYAGLSAFITDPQFSVKWEGYVVPQFTESYKLYVVADDGFGSNALHKLTVDDVLLINSGNALDSVSIAFVAGQYYKIKLEWSNSDNRPVGFILAWSSPSLENFINPSADGFYAAEVIPQSQLYTSDAGSLTVKEKKSHILISAAQAINSPLIGKTSENNTDIPDLQPGMVIAKAREKALRVTK